METWKTKYLSISPELRKALIKKYIGSPYLRLKTTNFMIYELPKTLKKSSQKDLASASSLTSFSHSLLNTSARLFISFQLSGIDSDCFVAM